MDFQSPSDLPLLWADEAKFKQIMYNLLSNAIKFTPDRGRIMVNAWWERKAAGEFEPGRNVSQTERLFVSVTDTGIGIHPRDQERIFLEFEQLDSSYGRQQQGTGLGLALTKRLVEMHGGHIAVESEGIEGKGCKFAFSIPQEAPKAEKTPSALARLDDSSVEKVEVSA